jgi:RNA polymerase sigma factor (sigma-70 family)
MNAAQFTDLLRRHAGIVHKVAYAYCRNATDREDVVQEIAVQLWRSRERYDETFRETTWIYRVALNVAISFYRRARRHHEHEQVEQEFAMAVVEPSPEMQWLLRAIDGLEPLEKALVVLYLDDNDHPTIAEVLGISVSNVGTKLGRIKLKLRALVTATATETKEKSRGTR